jgi:hydroxyacylglutathione hydrolase
MFSSLNRFKQLPDYVQVWPAHGAGSACGKALGAVPSTTVGYEKLVSWAFQIDDEETFVNTLLEGQPEPPKYFAMMKKLNKVGPSILGGVPRPARMTLAQFEKALKDGVKLVDTRNKIAFAGGHIPGSINIQDNKAFSTWAGWILNYDEPFMLIARDDRIDELTRELIRIGLDNVYGYLPDIEVWTNAGHELETLDQVTTSNLYEKIDDNNIQVLDVRGKSEYDGAHIPNAENIHAGYIVDRMEEVPKDKKVVVHCESGDRSSIAASLLQSKGFDNIINLTGGIAAWKQEGYPVEKTQKEEFQEA